MASILREIFSDNNGHLSSKRIVGTLMIIAAVVLLLLERGDSGTIATMIWAGVAALGVGTLETKITK